MKRGTGFLKHVGGELIAAQGRVVAATPLFATNERLLQFVSCDTDTRIRDQATSSSCVGQWVARTCSLWQRARGIVAPYASGWGAYVLGLTELRSSLNEPLYDRGSTVAAVVSGVTTWGVCKEDDWPLIEVGSSPIPEPNPAEMQASAGHPVLSHYRIVGEARTRCDAICRAIDQGMAPGVAIAIDTARFAAIGRSVLDQPYEAPDAFHMQTIAAYRTTATGRVFALVQSWGPFHGDGGVVYVHERVIGDAKACIEPTVLSIVPGST